MGKEEFKEYVESIIRQWEGTSYGSSVKNMYENGSSLESLADYLDIELED